MKRWILLLLIVIVACGSSTETVYTNDEFRTGIDGISMEFLIGMPDEVFENEVFIIAAELHNIGASDILEGYTLLSVEEDLIEHGTDAFASNFQLAGRSRENPTGDSHFVEYTVKAKPIALSKRQSSRYTLHACYNYQTSVQENICVDPRLRKLKIAPESCEAEDLALTDQGGPIAVTLIKVRPKISPDGLRRIQLQITVEHQGDGFVSLPVAASVLCSSGDIEDNVFNRVKLTGHLVDVPMECRRDGVVRLEENIGEIVCEVQAPTGGRSYSAPLHLVLEYGYSESVSQEVTIERLK